ncbi:homocitrate synthase [Mycobacterium sp. E1747]|uniref:homocitrate synthase n=1 Tax=Mycobacterium sp. E1747 TaxID=1834128 RepID=UPI0007FE2524|nr:homocitrate synthase [Mycobacterium sp. E1747]OBH12623.1 homocitrate synthase [Mycobacterium sp. E1747]
MTIPERLDPSTNPPARCPATVWFARQFGAPLPRGLREQAGAMRWDEFVATYARTGGPVRLGGWTCADTAGRLGPQARSYEAVIAVGDRIHTSAAAASGPIAALSAMLHDHGIRVEIVKFHQRAADGHTVTFVCGSNGARAEWAMGWSDDSTQSALRALIACANRLLA